MVASAGPRAEAVSQDLTHVGMHATMNVMPPPALSSLSSLPPPHAVHVRLDAPFFCPRCIPMCLFVFLSRVVEGSMCIWMHVVAWVYSSLVTYWGVAVAGAGVGFSTASRRAVSAGL